MLQYSKPSNTRWSRTLFSWICGIIYMFSYSQLIWNVRTNYFWQYDWIYVMFTDLYFFYENLFFFTWSLFETKKIFVQILNFTFNNCFWLQAQCISFVGHYNFLSIHLRAFNKIDQYLICTNVSLIRTSKHSLVALFFLFNSHSIGHRIVFHQIIYLFTNNNYRSITGFVDRFC